MMKLYSSSTVIILLLLFGCHAGRSLKVNQLYGEWRHTDEVSHLTVTLFPNGKFTMAREPVTQGQSLSMPATKHNGTWGLSGANEVRLSEDGNPPIFWHDVSIKGHTLRCRIGDVYFSFVRGN
jgi:hypothetical protein